MELNNFLNVDFSLYHIDKCAGTSLRKILYDYFSSYIDSKLIFLPELVGNKYNLMKEQDLISLKENKDIDFDNLKILLCHMNYKDPSVPIQSKIKITCVRNPIDRCISHYYFLKFRVDNKHIYELSDEEFSSFLVGVEN